MNECPGSLFAAARARWSGRGLRAALAGAVLLAVWTAPAVAQELPEPDPPRPVAAADVPEDVVEWFLDAGSQVVTNQAIQVLGLSPEAAAAAELGLIRSVMTWSPSYIEATSLVEPVVPAERWIAPVMSPAPDAGDADDEPEVEQTGSPDDSGDAESASGLADERTVADPAESPDPATEEEEANPGEYLGMLHAERIDNGGIRLQSFVPGAAPARDLASLDSEAMLVFDEVLDAWFAIVDGEVQPADADARESLAGSISLRDYQFFVAERYAADGDATAEGGGSASAEPAIWTAGILGSLLMLTAAIVWLRKGD